MVELYQVTRDCGCMAQLLGSARATLAGDSYPELRWLFCDTHGAAHDLLAALEEIEREAVAGVTYGRPGGVSDKAARQEAERICHLVTVKARAAIAKAKQEAGA